MDKPSRNFLNMIRAVSKTFAEKPATLTLAPALVEVFGEIGTLYGDARVLARRTEPSDGTHFNDKEDKVRAACEATQLTLGALLALAAKQQDAMLVAFADRSVSELMRLSDDKVIAALEEATARVRTRLADLVPYEVTANELDAAEDFIDRADQALDNPRHRINNRGAAVEQLDAKIGNLRLLLTQQFDPLLDRLAASPDVAKRDFAAQVQRARGILGAPGSSAAPTPPPAGSLPVG